MKPKYWGLWLLIITAVTTAHIILSDLINLNVGMIAFGIMLGHYLMKKYDEKSSGGKNNGNK